MAAEFNTGFTKKEVEAMCDGLVAYKKDIMLILADKTLEERVSKRAKDSMIQLESAKGKLENRQVNFTLDELKVIYFGLDSLKQFQSPSVKAAAQKIQACFRAYQVDIEATCSKFKLRPIH